VTPDAVTAVDFKTNRLVPPAPEEVPEGILRQMGAYLAMVEALYPGREARAAVLWTREAGSWPCPAPSSWPPLHARLARPPSP
jgi:ATP-dependent helicase/nuclease subunit A